MTTEHYEKGRADCRAYYASQAYSAFSRFASAESVMSLFWPPVEEQHIQFSTPLPKERQEWLAGFKFERSKMT